MISAAIYAAEATSFVQGTPPHLIPTPTTPTGQPLVTQAERELADVKRKQDEDRRSDLFDLSQALRPPDHVEQRDRDRDSRSER